MRILIITPILDPCHLWAGSHRVAYETAKLLAKRNHNVAVLTSDILSNQHKIRQSVHENDLHNCVNIIRYKTMNRRLTEMTSMTISTDYIRYLKSELHNFDIVHTHEYRTFENIVLAHYAKKSGVPYVLQAHGSLPRIMAKQGLKWIYDVSFGQRLLRGASKVIALSQMEAKQYKSMGVLEEKIEIIPNGIDLSEYSVLPSIGSFKKMFGMDEDEKIVLYVGRIHESKGLDLLAHAFKIISENIDRVKLVIVGSDDGYAAELSGLLHSLGLEEKVILTGFVDKSVKLAAFVDGEVFVTPCFSGFPIAFLESCLAGCPIITASGELEWINNNVGYVTEFSSGAIAKATITLLQDEQLRREFRKNSKHIIKKFDILNIIRQLEKVYGEDISSDCF